MSVYPVHPAADRWPMLGETDLRSMADSIKETGLIHPIVLDSEGRVIDGRNRLAACLIAGVEPTAITYTGDAVAYILASNERRNMTPPQKAAATARTLGKKWRKEGRWLRGSVPGAPGDEKDNSQLTNTDGQHWRDLMADAGLVLDIKEELLDEVIHGHLALDNAVQQVRAIRDAADAAKQAEQERLTQIAALPDDLRAIVEAGKLTLEDATRRARLHPSYAARVTSGALTISEAETLEARDTQEQYDSDGREMNRLLNFLDGWRCAIGLAHNKRRAEILARLPHDLDREQFLDIEPQLAGCTYRSVK